MFTRGYGSISSSQFVASLSSGSPDGPQVWAEDTAAAFRSLRALSQNSRGAEGGSQSLTYEEMGSGGRNRARRKGALMIQW